MPKKELIFLGSFFPIELELKIRSKSIGPIANANNALQWSYLKGLQFFYDYFNIITLPQVGAFPNKYKDIFFESSPSDFLINEKISISCINFFNIIFFKHFHRYFQSKSALEKILIKKNGKEIVIIVYDLQVSFLYAIKSLKSKYKNLKVCVIVPDLPFMTGAPENLFYKIFQKTENSFLTNTFDSIDLFILLSRHMAEKLPLKNKPWEVIEGIFDDENNNEIITYENSNEKIILYSGALTARNGINTLIEAFMQIKNTDFRLCICGAGQEESNIQKALLKDSRITFMGQLNRSEVLMLQKKATLLVNPRGPENEFTKYSFPSKTLEYFASGVPVLMFKIEGIPEEYYSYCYTFEENTVSSIKERIISICSKNPDELKNMGLKARKFIIENKNPKIQCSRLINFINENTPSN